MSARIQLTDRIALCIACLIAMHASPSHAQCVGEATSCLQCHEMQAQRPVLGSAAAWHRDHAFGDVCTACHGGQPDQAERASAHAGLRDPLEDPATSCAPCHEQDWARRAEGYAARHAAALIAATPQQPPRGPGATAYKASTLDRVLAVIVVLLGIAVACVLLAREPRRSIRRAQWSPYVTGAGLGVTLSITMIAFGRPLTVSAAFDELAVHVLRVIAPDAHVARQASHELSWNVWLVIGLLGGAFLSALLSRTFRLRLVPDARWREAFGDRVWLRWLVAFIGASLVQIGAAIAGGCTSGLAISGGAVMAPAAFLFMLGMFGGGIPTAMLLYSRKRGSR